MSVFSVRVVSVSTLFVVDVIVVVVLLVQTIGLSVEGGNKTSTKGGNKNNPSNTGSAS